MSLTSLPAALNLHIGIEIDDVPVRVPKPDGSSPPRLGCGRFDNLDVQGRQAFEFLVNVLNLELDGIPAVSGPPPGIRELLSRCVLQSISTGPRLPSV